MLIANKSLFGVTQFLDHLNYNFMGCWDSGHDMIIDKRTTGFQENYKDNICMTYKRIEDRFHDDAMCEEVYTHTF